MELLFIEPGDFPTAATWRDYALCGQLAVAPDPAERINPDIFYPAFTQSYQSKVDTEAARAICTACPVADWCLQEAVSTGQNAGIWGGLTKNERQQAVATLKGKTAISLGRAALLRQKFAQPLSREEVDDLRARIPHLRPRRAKKNNLAT